MTAAELLAHRPVFESYRQKYPRRLAQTSFPQIFIWQDFFAFDFEMIGDHLCVFASDAAGRFLFCPPLGQGYDGKIIGDCFLRMRKGGGTGTVARIENVEEAEKDFFPGARFKTVEKGREYIYHRQDLAELSGGEYKSKRHEDNFFRKHYAARYERFAPGMTKDCLALYDRWAMGRREKYSDEMYRYMLADSRQAHRRGMEFFQQLGLVGRVVMIDGEIAAYTFGYPLAPDVFCVLFEVADVAIHGLPVFIFKEFCQDSEVVPFPFINTLDDAGASNLTRSKLSFRPEAVISAYVVALKT